MRFRDFVSIVWLVVAASGLSACRGDDKTLKVGVIAGPEEQIAAAAVKLAKQRYGIDAKLITFSDYMNPNAALADGSLDANAFQHRPYLERQVQDRSYKLAVVGNTFVYPIAAYSLRIKRLAELRDGASIAVPNDPSNLGRALVLLEKHGLFALKKGVGVHATVLDIAHNPRKLRVVEIDAAQLPRSLPDVDLAVINTNYAAQIDLSPTRDGLFHEDKDSPYVNLIVSREDNKDRPELRDFVKAYQSEEVYAVARSLFHEGVIKGW